MAICPRGHHSVADDGYCDECGLRTEPDGMGLPPVPPFTEHCPVCNTPRTGGWLFCEACGHQFQEQAPTDPGPVYPPPVMPVPGPDPYVPVHPVPSTDPGPYYPSPDPMPGPGPEPYVPVHPAHPVHPVPSTDPGPYYPSPDPGPGPFVPMPPSPPTIGALWIVTITADHEYFRRVVAQGGPDASGMRFPPYHEPWTVQLDGTRMRVGRRRTTETASGGPEIDLSGPPSDPGISHLHVVFMNQDGTGWTLVDPGSRNGTTINGGEEAIDANVPVVLRDGDRVHVGAWTTLEVHVVAI